METPQIIVYTILSLLFIFTAFNLLLNIGKNIKDNKIHYMSLSVIGLLILFSIVLMISITLTAKINELADKIKGKCPELVKVENVYKIK